MKSGVNVGRPAMAVAHQLPSCLGRHIPPASVGRRFVIAPLDRVLYLPYLFAIFAYIPPVPRHKGVCTLRFLFSTCPKDVCMLPVFQLSPLHGISAFFQRRSNFISSCFATGSASGVLSWSQTSVLRIRSWNTKHRASSILGWKHRSSQRFTKPPTAVHFMRRVMTSQLPWFRSVVSWFFFFLVLQSTEGP